MDRNAHPRHWIRAQPQVWAAVEASGVLRALAPFDPVVTGSWPIAIALPGADVDVICHVPDLEAFALFCQDRFAKHDGFTSWVRPGSQPARVCRFRTDGLLFEVFGQGLAVERQNAYRHMVVEDRLLALFGSSLRAEVLRLKAQGLGTEPAFARALGLDGNPYSALLDLESLDDRALGRRFGPLRRAT